MRPANERTSGSASAGRPKGGAPIAIVFGAALLLALGALFRPLIHVGGVRKSSASADEALLSDPISTAVAPITERAREPRLSAPLTPLAVPIATERPPPERYRSAEQETSEVLDRLHATGAIKGAAAAEVAAVFDAWRGTSSLSSKVQFSPPTCYVGGCETRATYSDLTAFYNVNEEFQQTKSFRSWKGGRFRSGPIQSPSGTVIATWVFYRTN
jgi:hypothetical protein